MENYSLLRTFADSWALLVLFGFFLGLVLFVFRPGAAKAHRESADIPFLYDDAPAPADPREAASKEART